jgi:hypothetical protein
VTRGKHREASLMMLVGGAVAVVSGFLPWASVGPFTVDGMDGDGRITAALGAFVGVIGLMRLQRSRMSKWAVWVAIVCGVVIAVTGVVDYADLPELASAGIGLYGTIAGGVVGAIGGFIARKQPLVAPDDAPTRPPPSQPPPSAPAGWYPNPDDPARWRYWDGRTWTEHTS